MISRIDIEDMADAQDEAPETVCVKLTDGYEHNWWGVVTDDFDEDGVSYIRADLARPSQAGDERVARLEATLREIAAMATPSANATVRRMEAAALAAMDTPKGGGDE